MTFVPHFMDRPTPQLVGLKALVAGGLGAIGSCLTVRLVELGADVTVIDCLLPEGGGSLENIAPVRDRVRVVNGDVRGAMEGVCASSDLVFNLVGRTGHFESMVDPIGDLAMNCAAPLAVLEYCRQHAPLARVVFTSTRQVYGRPDALPVAEGHPLRPLDFNGIHKVAAEGYHILHHRLYGTATCVLRITNVLGPVMRNRDIRQMFLTEWIRRLLEGKPIEVWGGTQRRDIIDVDDCVDALVLAATCPSACGRVFNVGHNSPIRLDEIAFLLVRLHGRGEVIVREFPADRAGIEIGDYCSDTTAISQALGWRARVTLEESLSRALVRARREDQNNG